MTDLAPLFAPLEDHRKMPHVVPVSMEGWEPERMRAFHQSFDEWREACSGKGVYATRTLTYATGNSVPMLIEFRFSDPDTAFDFKMKFK